MVEPGPMILLVPPTSPCALCFDSSQTRNPRNRKSHPQSTRMSSFFFFLSHPTSNTHSEEH
jgi:hypothetical protein